MIRFYSPVLILQLFCLYHCYTHQGDRKWYWLIIFFPLIGSLIYLYDTFYNRRNIDQISEGIQQVFNSNYKIDKLERELSFSDTFKNKAQLADEHLAIGNYDRAKELYESCLEGIYKNDPTILKKLIHVNYLQGNYPTVVQFGKRLKDVKTFQNADERVAYAWSLYHNNDFHAAEKEFESMDARFTNYGHRLAYAKFLNQLSRPDESLKKLKEMMDEIDSMERQEKRFVKNVHREISRFHDELAH